MTVKAKTNAHRIPKPTVLQSMLEFRGGDNLASPLSSLDLNMVG